VSHTNCVMFLLRREDPTSAAEWGAWYAAFDGGEDMGGEGAPEVPKAGLGDSGMATGGGLEGRRRLA
jgi:hypothetical protein